MMKRKVYERNQWCPKLGICLEELWQTQTLTTDILCYTRIDENNDYVCDKLWLGM